MKKFTFVFALSAITVTQGLKISETIQEKVQIGHKLEAQAVPSPIQAISNDFQSLSSFNSSIQNLVSSSQGASNSSFTGLTNTQQGLNQVSSQIQNLSISFASIGSSLVNSIQGISQSLSSMTQGNSTLTNSLSQLQLSVNSQISQLQSDYSNLINGNYGGQNIVALPGCFLQGNGRLNTYRNPSPNVQAAIQNFLLDLKQAQNWGLTAYYFANYNATNGQLNTMSISSWNAIGNGLPPQFQCDNSNNFLLLQINGGPIFQQQ